MKEIWKPVLGYEGLYEVSNLGRVKSLNWKRTNTHKCLYLKKHNKGYKQVELVKDKSSKMFLVHRLVANAFLDNPFNKTQINHKDYDKTNNNVDNLEWCTNSENMKHSCLRKNDKPKRRKEKILQFDIDGNFLKLWDDCISIKKEKGFNQTSIFECCENKRKTAYGYLWRYST